MKSYRKNAKVRGDSRFNNAVVREVMGHLVLLVPVVLVLFAGLVLVRMVESQFDEQRHAALSPLTDADAQTQLSHCPALRGDRVVDIKAIKPYLVDQRKVDYEYRDVNHSEILLGTAQFAWRRGAWHAVMCR